MSLPMLLILGLALTVSYVIGQGPSKADTDEITKQLKEFDRVDVDKSKLKLDAREFYKYISKNRPLEQEHFKDNLFFHMSNRTHLYLDVNGDGYLDVNELFLVYNPTTKVLKIVVAP